MSKVSAQRLRQLTTKAVVARWTLSAKLRGIQLRVHVHPQARIMPGAILEVIGGKGQRATIILDRGAQIDGGVLVRMSGGSSIQLGPDTVVRRFAVLNVSGKLAFQGQNLLSWHSVVHCADEVVFEHQAGTGEGVTVVDGRHFRRHSGDHWYHNSTASAVRIEANAWLASHSTIGPGVTVGRAATVAAGSVVLADVPDETLVAGAPARVVRESINTAKRSERGSP